MRTVRFKTYETVRIIDCSVSKNLNSKTSKYLDFE